jgi:O-antigen ligase
MILVAAAIGGRLAGPRVIQEFDSSFNAADARDYSAQSRVDLWRDCTITMFKHPLFGIGQDLWGDEAEKFGWNKGKEAHSLWFQTAAELGIPGVSFLFGFYALTVLLLWQASRRVPLPRLGTLSRMVIVSLVGFASSASFVTVEGFELPFYVALVGAVALKVAYRYADAFELQAWQRHEWSTRQGSFRQAGLA